MSSRVAILVGAAVLTAAAAPAHAKTAKTSKAATSSKSHKHKHKHAKPTLANNMPPSWTWPPSRGMRAAGAKCLAKLDQLGVKYKRAGAVKKIATPIIVPSMRLGGLELVSLWREGPFEMDCDLALTLETYGPKLAAVGVKALQFSRIYGYTPVRTGGTVKPFLSRHALGIAIDVYAFVDTDGTKHVVETDYPAGDQFLLDVEQAVNDSGGFRLCLTPKNDPLSHHDHFHLEANVIYPPSAPPRLSARDGGHKRR
jgi:hypothetical protein